MFEPLVTADPKGNPLPMLAVRVPSLANHGISRDGLTITYQLRKDARWSDGVPVTASDVKWSWQAIMNPDNNVVSRHGYDVINRIDTPDDYTVVVHLKSRFSPFVNTFFAESDQPYPSGPAHVLSQLSEYQQDPVQQRADGQRRAVPLRAVVARRSHYGRAQRRLLHGQARARSRSRSRSFPTKTPRSTCCGRTASTICSKRRSKRTSKSERSPTSSIVWVNVNGYDALQLNLSRPLLRDQHVTSADRLCRRQERNGTYPYVRDAARRDGRHSGLDVGVQSGGTFLSARSRHGERRCCARPAGARAPTASCARTASQLTSGDGDEQLERDATA